MLTTRAVGHAASVHAQRTTMRLDLATIHSCSNDCIPLLHFKGLHIKQLIAGDIFFHFGPNCEDDGDALVRLLQPEGPLSSQVQQRLQGLEMLWLAVSDSIDHSRLHSFPSTAIMLTASHSRKDIQELGDESAHSVSCFSFWCGSWLLTTPPLVVMLRM